MIERDRASRIKLGTGQQVFNWNANVRCSVSRLHNYDEGTLTISPVISFPQIRVIGDADILRKYVRAYFLLRTVRESGIIKRQIIPFFSLQAQVNIAMDYKHRRDLPLSSH